MHEKKTKSKKGKKTTKNLSLDNVKHSDQQGEEARKEIKHGLPSNTI